MQVLSTDRGEQVFVLDQAPIRGGEACVYRARGPAGEDLAVKVALLPGEGGRWLEAEAERLDALSACPDLQPFLVPLWGRGRWLGRPFLVMPWMPCTLAEAARAADPAGRRSLAAAACAAVAALHAADPSLVHRDLKPTNLLVDAEGRVRVADLGAARQLRVGETTTVCALHTPGFAPPELLLQGPQRPRRDQDLYALAATVFALLVGQPPNAATWNAAELRRHPQSSAQARLRALSPGDRRALRAVGLDARTVALLEVMLAPDPAARRGSAADLQAALRAGPTAPGGWGLLLLGGLLALGLLAALPAAPARGRYPAVEIPAGHYAVHPSAGQPGDRVVLDRPLLVGRTELSQGLWRELMGTDLARQRRITEYGGLGASCARDEGLALAGEDLPALCVGWLDAVAVANALSRAEGLRPAYALTVVPGDPAPSVARVPQADGWRLPTSAEWDLLAGDCVEDALLRCDDGIEGPAPVGRALPGCFGLLGVGGNLREWVEDPAGPGRHRVRDRSWKGGPQVQRGGGPQAMGDDELSTLVGLRLVREPR